MKLWFNANFFIKLKVWNVMAAQQHSVFQNFLNRSKELFQKDWNAKILPKTSLEDYEFLRILGHGSYGQVVAAKNIITDKIFAVKIIKKKKLATEDQVKHLISEIKILNAIKFDFLISLECYFTNECYVFIVMPHISGGQLLKLIKRSKRFDESTAKFFAGQVVLAIEYLHANGIVYRDLKPENLLLDSNGYIKLVDFGFAKQINNNFTYTFCGTPEYIAPEIILSKGYSKSPDWWALGILLYEMCAGVPPFTSKNELKLYEKILVGNIVCPDYFSSDLKSVIRGLLQVNRSKRLGCMKNGVEDIKFHEWFSSLDWIVLWNKKIIPPTKYTTGKKPENDIIEKNFSFTKAQACPHIEALGNLDYGI